MSERKFKFVSPGVFLKEIDQSQIPESPEPVGPVIIGRSSRGPAMRPIAVNSFSEFVNTFGRPFSQESVDDVWRDGNKAGTTYGSYAAKAWLKNSDKLTFIRLLGKQSPNYTTDKGEAGWSVAGDAYGLWLFASSSNTYTTGCLAAIIYSTNSDTTLALSGTLYGTSSAVTGANAVPVEPIIDGSPTSAKWKVIAYNDRVRRSDSGTTGSYTFDFDSSSKDFIRKVFNTDPTMCNSSLISDTNVLDKLFLGQTFENRLSDTDLIPNTSTTFGIMMKMQASGSGAENGNDFRQASTKGQTNWFIGQDLNADTSSYVPANMQRLFKLVARDAGEWTQNNLKVSITNLRYGSISGSYGNFDVVLRRSNDTDQVIEVVERFSGLTLDPTDTNFIGRKIGTKYISYDTTNNRNIEIGEYDNKSKYVYVQYDKKVENGTAESELLPFGVLGPVGYKAATYVSSSNSFTTAGTPAIAASAVDALKITGGTVYNNDTFTVLVPENAGGLGVTATVIAKTSLGSTPSANQIHWLYSGTDATKIANLKLAINGTDDTAKVKFGSGITNGATVGIKGLTATVGVTSEDSFASLTADKEGTNGNSIALTDTVGTVLVDEDQLTDGKLAGGNGGTALATDAGPMARGFRSSGGVKNAFSASDGNPDEALRPQIFLSGSGLNSLQFNYPTVDVRTNATGAGTINPKNAYWGAYTGRTTSNSIYGKGLPDLVKVMPSSISNIAATTDLTAFEWSFSLDNISASYSGARVINAAYATTYRTAGTSVTSKEATGYKKLLDLGLGKFTTVFAGGSDGLEITEKEPFRNALMNGKTEDNSYEYYTVKTAIDLCKDPENISFNIASVPALNNPGLTKRLLDHCENRGDALCVMDLENDFLPPPDRTDQQTVTSTAVTGDVDNAVGSLRDRQLNSSFGCAYYPWVQCLDDETNKVVYLPPSVVALGVMSYTDAQQGPWFAPAGFNRGGLSTGVAGIPVLNATQKLTSDNRDDLYENNINPIASFPNEGVVIFGQKTLQVTRSALDRINVRRMLIYVKRQISQIAANLLFEPNVPATWNKFKAAAIPMLTDVQQRFGIQEYKLVLDETTTTPDLIDQNILYAKLFIKPTRAIEFIAVDFFITNTGASFED